MKRKRLWVRCFLPLLSVILILGLVIAGCGPAAPGKESIKVGFSISLSGIFAAATPSQMQAYQLWAEQVNERGGIFVKDIGKRLPVELVYYDDKSLPEEAVRIYERLITVDKVDLLLAPWGTDIHVAIVPTVEKYHVPVVGNTAVATMLEELDTRYFWFLSAMPEEIMRNLVDLLVAHRDEINTVAVLYVHGVFEVDLHEFLIPFLEREGFDIVMDKDYPMEVKDLSSELLDLKRKNVDALIAFTEAEDAILLFSQAMGVDLNPKFFYMLLGPGWAVWPEIFGEVTDGVCFFEGNAWTREGPGPGSAEFYDSYVERWGEPPDYLDSAFPWASLQVVEQAIDKAGTLDWEKLRDTIATEEFITIWGPVEFEGSFNIHGNPAVVQWQKGKVELVWPTELATAEITLPKPPWPK